MIRPPSALVLIACVFGVAHAQPAMLDPGEIEAALREAHRAGPIAERIEITQRDAEGHEQSGLIELWLDAERERLGLRMGGLRVWVGDGALALADASSGGRIWTVDHEGPPSMAALVGELPPLPLPQLTSTFGERTPGVTPWTPDLRWELARRSARTVHLVGRSGAVAVTARVADGRWRHWTARHEVEGWSIELNIRSLSREGVMAAATWRLDPDGRRHVDTIADLRPAPDPSSLEVLEDLSLISMSGRASSFSFLLRSLEPDAVGVILLYRGDDEEAEAQRRAAEIASRLPPDRDRVRVWAVASYPLVGFERTRLVAESARWDRRLREGDRLFWRVGLDDAGDRLGGAGALHTLAVDTGGRVWVDAPVEDEDAIDEVIEQIRVAISALGEKAD